MTNGCGGDGTTGRAADDSPVTLARDSPRRVASARRSSSSRRSSRCAGRSARRRRDDAAQRDRERRPRPSTLRTRRSPPMPRARSRLIASPSPVPPVVAREARCAPARTARRSPRACRAGCRCRCRARAGTRGRPPRRRRRPLGERERTADAPRRARRELHRVRQQVEQHLRELLAVGPHERGTPASASAPRPRTRAPSRATCGSTIGAHVGARPRRAHAAHVVLDAPASSARSSARR